MIDRDSINKLFRDVWAGQTTIFRLPLNVYQEVARELMRGVFQGFGGSFSDFDIQSPDFKLLRSFQKNTYQFSAAKEYQYVKDTQRLIVDSKGFKRNFTDFQKDAKKVYNVYYGEINESIQKQELGGWLKTEFNTSISQSQAGQEWLNIQKEKESLPLLQFITVGDDRVRIDHSELDGTIKPVDDPFWNTYYPPLAWNCRCIVQQLESKDEATIPEKTPDLRRVEKPELLFRKNPGKSGQVFDEKRHPYFKVGSNKDLIDYKNDNFGLPLP